MNVPSNIPFAYPFIKKEEEDAALRVLRSGWLTTGKEALAFEKEFAAFLDPTGKLGIKALAVNSATSGLHLAVEACGIQPGDVVITSPYTFTATAEVVRYLGADVAFVDVVPGGYLIDPEAVRRCAARLARGLCAYPDRGGESKDFGPQGGFGPRGRPALIMPIHVAGLPCDMAALKDVAAEFGMKIIEDAAHSFPSKMEDGSYAGDQGDLGVFSFYATKTISTGEGGMVVTRDAKLAERVSIMRSHGIDRSIWNRYTDTKASWRYQVVEAGFKYNLSDILAAIGRVQLTRAEALLQMRRDIAARYDVAFEADDRFIIPPTGPADARHLYPLRLAAGKKMLERDDYIQRLQELGIGVSVHFIPLHSMPYYAERYELADADFPEAMNSFRHSISLPIWPGMSGEMIDRVITSVVQVAGE